MMLTTSVVTWLNMFPFLLVIDTQTTNHYDHYEFINPSFWSKQKLSNTNCSSVQHVNQSNHTCDDFTIKNNFTIMFPVFRGIIIIILDAIFDEHGGDLHEYGSRWWFNPVCWLAKSAHDPWTSLLIKIHHHELLRKSPIKSLKSKKIIILTHFPSKTSRTINEIMIITY